LASWTLQNAMLNEKLATFLLLEGTSMQHVERSNVCEATGGVDVIFQGKGAVRNDSTQQTEAMDLQLDWLEALLLFWEHNLDERENEILNC
jgi:hypothetical protein